MAIIIIFLLSKYFSGKYKKLKSLLTIKRGSRDAAHAAISLRWSVK